MTRVGFEAFVADHRLPEAFTVLGGADAAPEPVAPGTTCLIALEDDRPRARCTLGIRADLRGAPGCSGWVGHYEARDPEPGAALLREAARRLAAQGAERVLGPMNGSTWARYRLVVDTEPGDVEPGPPPFPGEPRNPPEYPRHFHAAGFEVVARYESRLDDLAHEPPDVKALAERVAAAGFSLRPFDVDHFDAELERLFALSLEAFAENLYYAPIGAEAFRAMYEPLRGRIDPEFVLIALDRDEAPCGYLFAFADPPATAASGTARLVSKTVAVLPRARGRGLANHMLDRLRWSGRRRGFRELVHALMQVSNASMRMSARGGGRVFRRYALYQWTPGAAR